LWRASGPSFTLPFAAVWALVWALAFRVPRPFSGLIRSGCIPPLALIPAYRLYIQPLRVWRNW